jgi:hypothetical protein
MLERMTHAQITGEEGVGIAKRPHRDVLHGPRPDPWQRQQLLPALWTL